MGEKSERILWAKHPDALLELAIAWLDRAGRIHDCEHCIENSVRLQRRWDQLTDKPKEIYTLEYSDGNVFRWDVSDPKNPKPVGFND